MINIVKCVSLFFLIFSNVKAQTSQMDYLRNNFLHHFRILDSAQKVNKKLDTICCCNASINFMDLTTSLDTHTIGNVFGRSCFTKQELIDWHKWYKKNIEYTRK